MRFRRKGYPGRNLPLPRGYHSDMSSLMNSPEFMAAYLAAMAEPVAPLKPGEKRAAYGCVDWLVTEYLGSLDFLGRPKSVRIKHRKHCEDFRTKRGNLPVARLEQEHLEKLLAKMINTPAAANQWLVAMRDLMKYAIKRKLLVVNPAAAIAKRSSGNPDGHHTWTAEQVEQFRRRHPIGSKARLALELINDLAFRRSDAIRVGPPDVRGGVLRYTQHKMREHSPSRVEVPLPADLVAIIRATPGTGHQDVAGGRSRQAVHRGSVQPLVCRPLRRAGLPTKTRPSGEVVRLCTSHGLRKRPH